MLLRRLALGSRPPPPPCGPAIAVIRSAALSYRRIVSPRNQRSDDNHRRWKSDGKAMWEAAVAGANVIE